MWHLVVMGQWGQEASSDVDIGSGDGCDSFLFLHAIASLRVVVASSVALHSSLQAMQHHSRRLTIISDDGLNIHHLR